jgi:hypothetical protein
MPDEGGTTTPCRIMVKLLSDNFRFQISNFRWRTPILEGLGILLKSEI